MAKTAQVHYLEIVTKDVEKVCTSYAQTLHIVFSEAIAELGGARIAELCGGGAIGVRAPMHDSEEPTTRPYYLVSDIQKAVAEAQATGAELAVPPIEIPGRGQCAVLMYGPIQSGLWQL